MKATPDELEALFEIQSIDLEMVRLQKELDELPQRAVILEAREKRKVLQSKLAQVEALKKEAAKKLAKIDDEDSSLAKKEGGVQAAIEAAAGDFRSAEARTKELDGIFRRRNTLSEDREKAKAELDKITALEQQINAALKDIDAREASATESFKEQGGALNTAIAQAKAKHEQLLDGVDADLARLYDRTSKIFDTVFIGKLDGDKCSVCRATIETGRLLAMKSEAPPTTCPSCKRLLIVEVEA